MSLTNTSEGEDRDLVASLKEAAKKTRDSAQNDTDRLCANLLDRAADQVDGKCLRAWMARLSNEQAAELSWDDLRMQTPEASGLDLANFENQKKSWESRVIHDGAGRAMAVRADDYIERLAHWVAKEATLPEWIRSKSDEREVYTTKVHELIQQLVDLLQKPGAPEWPSLIELFDEAHRPIYVPEAISSDHFKRQIRNRLAGQRIDRALLRLAEVAAAKKRLADLRAPAVPRPNMRARLEKKLAKDIAWWFESQCHRKGTTTGVRTLIAELMSWVHPANEFDERQVGDWLRPDRYPGQRKSKARKSKPSD